MKNKLKRFMVMGMVALLVLPSIVLAFPQKAYAAQANPSDQLERWLMYRGMRGCFEKPWFGAGITDGSDNEDVSVSDINAGHLDMQGYDGATRVEGFGYLGPDMDEANGNDGDVKCSDGSIFVRGAHLFGFDSVLGLICAMNRALEEPDINQGGKITPNNALDCEQSTKINFDGGGDADIFQRALTRALEKEGDKDRPYFSLNSNNGPVENGSPAYSYGALYYLIGKRSLEIFCGNNAQIETASQDNDKYKDSNDIVEVSYVTSNGDVKTGQSYAVANEDRTEGSSVSGVFYRPGGNDNEADNMTCAEMATLTRDNAQKYADWAKNHKDANQDNQDQNESAGTDPTCESEGGALAWIGCAGLKVLDAIVSALDGVITSLLFIDSNQYNNDSIKNAWGVMRNIALLILVPMMMLMVIGTALEFGPFDAYTVKKALPRMMAAVIFITLSLVIAQFAVRISNSLGDGVGNLINTAMRQSGNPIGSLAELFDSNDGFVFYGLAQGGFALGVGALAIGSITWGILGSLALVTIVALLIGTLILVIRQVLIVFLIIVAPLAILVWIFPGNDKLWKIWKSTFTVMLLMYPLIILLIMSGRFFAGVVKASDPTISLVNLILMLVAYITPYFLIPSAFKYGLGVFGNLAGMINDKSRGLFDRQRKFRSGVRAENWQKFKEGRLNANPIARMNKVQNFGRKFGAYQASDNKLALLRNLGNQGGTAWQAADSTWKDIVRGRYDKDERTAASKENDDQLQAQTYKSEAEARRNIARDWKWATPTTPAEQQAQQERIEAAVQAARNNGGFSESIANSAIRAAGRTGTAIDDIEVLQKNTLRIAGTNKSQASSILGEINATTKQVARNDLAAGYGKHMELYDKLLAGTATAADFQAAHLQAAEDMDAVTFLRMKKKGVTNSAKALQVEFDAAVAAGNNARAAAIAGVISKIEQSGSYASFTNVAEAADVAVQPTRGTTTTPVTLADGRVVQIPTDGRRGVVIKGSTTQQTVNPITDSLETVYEVDAAGNYVLDPLTGQRKPLVNYVPAPQDPTVTEQLRRHSPRAPGKNPNDPDY